MASGRVGGTKSKIRGQVGNTIFQVRKNEDGTYTQISMAKGERTETQTSPRLQAQRMCTAMVESLMRDLKEIGRISMQSAANKSKSLNAFSSYNLQLVARDCKANWYGNQNFVYPQYSKYEPYTQDLGGLYMISSGTLQYNVFDYLYDNSFGDRNWDNYNRQLQDLNGVVFQCNLEEDTLEDFLKNHRMTLLDSFVFVAFRQYLEFDVDTEEYIPQYRHSYIIAQINPQFNLDEVITIENVRQLFITKSNYKAVVCSHEDLDKFLVGFALDIQDKDEQCYYWAAFSISFADGKRKISSSSYKPVSNRYKTWLDNSAPADVFGSWMTDHQNKPYPSPFI